MTYPIGAVAPIKVYPKAATKTHSTSTYRRVVVLPDMQMGFRRLGDGKLDPFHNEAALELALTLISEIDPHQIVLLGDNLDMAEWSLKYATGNEFADTTQASLDSLASYLAQVVANSRKGTEIAYLSGNHEKRLETLLVSNAKMALGLKRANSLPEDAPVLSVPHLLRLKELGVTYLDGYPANRYFLNDAFQAIHGFKVRSNGSTAAAVINDLDGVSTVFGHVHRQELTHRTVHTAQGPVVITAASPGCLCRIDGSVPSTKGGRDTNGRSILAYENWQNGIGVLEYNAKDHRDSYYQNVLFRQVGAKTQTLYNGKLLKA